MNQLDCLLDRKILQVLQIDARCSLQEIGQAVGLSPSPYWGRIKKMQEAGVIEGYTVRLNAPALGLGDTVMVQVTLDSHSDNTLERVHDLLSISAKKAKCTNCRLVLRWRSQFFHSRHLFSSQAKLRSTTHRLAMTANLCSSRRLATCTVTCSPSASCTPCVNGLPV